MWDCLIPLALTLVFVTIWGCVTEHLQAQFSSSSQRFCVYAGLCLAGLYKILSMVVVYMWTAPAMRALVKVAPGEVDPFLAKFVRATGFCATDLLDMVGILALFLTTGRVIDCLHRVTRRYSQSRPVLASALELVCWLTVASCLGQFELSLTAWHTAGENTARAVVAVVASLGCVVLSVMMWGMAWARFKRFSRFLAWEAGR